MKYSILFLFLMLTSNMAFPCETLSGQFKICEKLGQKKIQQFNYIQEVVNHNGLLTMRVNYATLSPNGPQSEFIEVLDGKWHSINRENHQDLPLWIYRSECIGNERILEIKTDKSFTKEVMVKEGNKLIIDIEHTEGSKTKQSRIVCE